MFKKTELIEICNQFGIILANNNDNKTKITKQFMVSKIKDDLKNNDYYHTESISIINNIQQQVNELNNKIKDRFTDILRNLDMMKSKIIVNDSNNEHVSDIRFKYYHYGIILIISIILVIVYIMISNYRIEKYHQILDSKREHLAECISRFAICDNQAVNSLFEKDKYMNLRNLYLSNLGIDNSINTFSGRPIYWYYDQGGYCDDCIIDLWTVDKLTKLCIKKYNQNSREYERCIKAKDELKSECYVSISPFMFIIQFLIYNFESLSYTYYIIYLQHF